MSDLEQLRQQLRGQSEETRHAAVQKLASLGQEALPLLSEALGDMSWRVRKAALEAVVLIPGEERMRILLEGIRDEESAGRRNTSMEALIRLGEETVPSLSDLLGDADPDVRKFGVDILGNIESVRVVAPLLASLEDEEDNVAAAAAEYLGRKRHQAAITALIARAKRGGFWVTYSCIRSLGEIGDPAAGPAILEIADDKGLRKVALEALGKLGIPEAEPLILESLFSEDRSLRKIAILAAARLVGRLKAAGEEYRSFQSSIKENAGAEFVDYLKDLLRHDDSVLRTSAMVILGAAAGSDAINPLLGILPYMVEEDRDLVVDVLEDLPEDDLPVLFPKLRSGQAAVRRRVSQVLGRRACKGAVPYLVRLLEDDDGHVRGAAAGALGAIGDQLAVAPLVTLLSDPYPDVQQSGVKALSELGEGGDELRQLVLNLLDSHLDSHDNDLVTNALRVLARLGSVEVIDKLKFALKDERSKVRMAAVEALGMIDSEEARDVLRLALADEEAKVRREAVHRIGENTDPGTLTCLLPMLKDEDLWVRVRAVQAIAARESDKAHGVLLRIAREEEAGPVKLAAIRALGHARVASGRDLLLSLAKSGDRENRMAAIEALGHMGGEETVATLIACLEDKDWGLRSAAVKSLGAFAGEDKVLSVLKALVRDEADPMIRKAAADLLGESVPPGDR